MNTIDELSERQRQTWSAAASGWERWADVDEAQMHALCEWSARALGVTAGMQLLDVGCGSGLPSLYLATCVRPGGTVLATDLVPEMLEVAARRARARGLENIRFQRLDIGRDPLPERGFDGVTCHFGLMFVPDPIAAARAMRDALRDGGRVAIVCWGAPEQNPFLAIPARRVAEALQAPPPEPDAPQPFRFADPGALASTLRAAGFDSVETTTVAFAMSADSPTEFWRILLDHASMMRKAVEGMPADEAAGLAARVQADVESFRAGAGLRFPARAVCATGRR